MTCFPIEKKKTEKKSRSAVMNAMFLLAAIFFVSIAVIGPASADQYSEMWANITAMVNGMATVMPAVSNIILSVIQPILMLIFVGFFSGLFDGLLGGITHAFNFGHH